MKFYLIFWGIICTSSVFAQSNQQITKYEFNYEMNLQVDFKKREAYLQRIGKKAEVYEKAISFIKGSVHAANVTDKLTLTDKTYEITSVANLTTALNVALSGQQLKRTSVGKNSKNTLITDFYSERRGKSPSITASFNLKNNKVEFFKAKKIVADSPYVNSLDVLNLAYAYVGKKLPEKNFNFFITDGKSIKKFTMNRAEIWDFPYNGSTIKAVRYVKTISNLDPVTLEIWYSLDAQIPMRYVIGLSEKYGATIQADLKSYKKI